MYLCSMEKETKTYSELDEIQRLKISKIFIYQKLNIEKKKCCKIVFENAKMKYLFIDDDIIDL